MTDKKPKQKEVLSGEYSQIEQDILKYLYEYPGSGAGTVNLVQVLNPGLSIVQPSQELQHALANVQYAVETLIVYGLVKGDRVKHMGLLQYLNLNLTPSGEIEAIKQKRRVPATLTGNTPKEDQSTD